MLCLVVALAADNATGDAGALGVEYLAECSGVASATLERDAAGLIARGVLERRQTYTAGSGQGWSRYRLTHRWEGIYWTGAAAGVQDPPPSSSCVGGAPHHASDLSAPDPDLPPDGDPDLTPQGEIALPGVSVDVVHPEAPAVDLRPRHGERATTGGDPHPGPSRPPPTRGDADRILETLRGLMALACLASRSYALRLLELALGTPASPAAPAVEGLGVEAVLRGLHEVALAAGDARAMGAPWDRDKLARKVRSYCAGVRPRPPRSAEVEDRSGREQQRQQETTPMQGPDPAGAAAVVQAIDRASEVAPRRSAERPPPVKVRAEVPEGDRRPIAEIAAARPGDDLLALVAVLAAEGHGWGTALADRIVTRGLRFTAAERSTLETIKAERGRRAAPAGQQPLGSWTPDGERPRMPVVMVGGKLIGAQPTGGWKP